MPFLPPAAGLFLIPPVLAQVVAAPVAGRMLDQGGPRRPVVLGIALLAAGAAVVALGFPAQSIWLILLGTILGGAGFAFTNPVQMAALSETPLEQRGMLAGIFPLAGNFGTAFFVALLTAGLNAFMGRYLANNPARPRLRRRPHAGDAGLVNRRGDGGAVAGGAAVAEA